jgi:hypothetical protein
MRKGVQNIRRNSQVPVDGSRKRRELKLAIIFNHVLSVVNYHYMREEAYVFRKEGEGSAGRDKDVLRD